MTAVESLAAKVAGGWWNTGGGCMGIGVTLANGGEVLITDKEDVFSGGDWSSDADVSGFYAAYSHPGYGEDHNDYTVLYHSPDRIDGPVEIDYPDTAKGWTDFEQADAEHKAAWLAAEVEKCATAVNAFLALTPRTDVRADQ